MLKQWINLSHSGIDFQRVFRYRLERKEVPYERGRKELLDMMVGERVDMLLTLMKRAEKKEASLQLINLAETIMGKLPKDDWTILDDYINDMTDHLADEGTYLYSSGFTDGIWALKFINSL